MEKHGRRCWKRNRVEDVEDYRSLKKQEDRIARKRHGDVTPREARLWKSGILWSRRWKLEDKLRNLIIKQRR